jgi:hypothetical protein
LGQDATISALAIRVLKPSVLLLRQLAGSGGIQVIAEERSLDGLFGAKPSVGNQVADSLRLTHRYGDPSLEEQSTLDIAHPGKTNPSAFSAVSDPHEVDPEVAAAHEIRGRCWLQRIVALDSWPVLFVCGAHHVEPFHEWLRANSIVVHVLCRRWTPD